MLNIGFPCNPEANVEALSGPQKNDRIKPVMTLKVWLISWVLANMLLTAGVIRAEAAPKVPVKQPKANSKPLRGVIAMDKIYRSEEEWEKVLSPEQYQVMRQKGTERAFSGKYWNSHETGMYQCAACGADLFNSKEKFDSGCGWPSFWQPVDNRNLIMVEDHSLNQHRIEIRCARCGSHLGHVFDDGPAPTGQRYCVNSIALEFKEKKPENKKP